MAPQSTKGVLLVQRSALLRRASGRTLAVVLLVSACQGQQVITTIAGTDFVFPQTPLAATSAPLQGSLFGGVATDNAGNLYLADGANRVFRVDPSGTLYVVAGNGITGFSGDGGPAASASLNGPQGVAVDSAGNIYIADTGNNLVRMVSSAGVITTIAGTAVIGGKTVTVPTGVRPFPRSPSVAGSPASTAPVLSANPSGLLFGGVPPGASASQTVVITNQGSASASITVSVPQGASWLSVTPTTAILTPFFGTVKLTVKADASGLSVGQYNSQIVVSVSGRTAISVAVQMDVGTTFAGDGGLATAAQLSYPVGVAVDTQGNLYIADTNHDRIRQVKAGIITTIAGNSSELYSGDGGPATSGSLFHPHGVAVDSAGNLYIADAGHAVVRKVSAAGIITTVAGNGKAGYSGDGGPALSASLDFTSEFSYPAGNLAVDSAGNLYIADTGNDRIREVPANGTIIMTIAGNGGAGYSGDGGPATSARLDLPSSLAVDSAGNLYIADLVNGRVRKVTPGGAMSTAAGSGTRTYGGDGGQATSALVYRPESAVADPAGNLYLADTGNNRVRKISRDGVITTLAGNVQPGYSGDGGAAASALLDNPTSVAVDSTGNVYVADFGNSVVRKISASGIITTVAGNGQAAYSGDGGLATSTSLELPAGVAVDSTGNLYIACRNRVREVSPGGIISTLAGNGQAAYSGDGGLATAATLNSVNGVAVDAAGNVYIADTGNAAIRKVSAAGIISTIAGNDQIGYSGDGGLATSASLDFPAGVAVDSAGNVYIVDQQQQVIRKVTAATGIITTVAGNGQIGRSGDGGLATSATFNFPAGVAVDSAGNVLVADTWNNRIREVLAAGPPLTAVPASLVFSGQSTGEVTLPQSFTVSSVPELGFTIAVSTASGGDWLSVTPQTGAAPLLINVAADPAALTAGVYQGTITINAPNANPTSTVVNVVFTVTSSLAPSLAVNNQSLSFSFPKSGSPQTQKFTVSNAGGGTLNFSAGAAVATPAGGAWLSVSPPSGQATPALPATITVTADSTGLSPGTYTGTVTVSGAGSVANVAVTITVSSLSQVILLSQRGLSFSAVAQGGVIPPQTFAVQNVGTDVVPWTVSKSTLSGGPDWLQVTPTSGSSNAAQSPPTISVGVSAANLMQGIYYGLVQVNAPSAANSPQVVTIFLQVAAAGTNAAAVVDQGSMLFTALTGGESPGSQVLSVYNVTANSKSFSSTVSAYPGLTLITSPMDATLDPQNPTRIVIQPFTTGLPAGVYQGTLTLRFSDGRVLPVNLQVIVSSTGGAGGAPSPAAAQRGALAKPLDASSCTPALLVPVLISLADSFELPTGLPVNLGVYLADDCGNPVQTGSVTAKFSTGGSTPLLSLKGGLWQGQWLTQTGALSTATVKVHAVSGGLVGDQQVTGNLLDLQQPPAFDQSGIAASFGGLAYTPIAPGSVISIYGTQLAGSTGPATGNPLPTQWLGTQVFISGGSDVLLGLPLYYVSPNQLNAVIPYEVATNVPLQLLVQRGSAASQPVPVNVAAAGPAVYDGPDAITDYPAGGGAAFTVTADTPATAGDTVAFYCLGLGLVDQTVADGSVPDSASATANPALVQIGSQTVPATFAALTPATPGLYLVNVVIPPGTGTGSAVQVTVTIGGQTSQPIPLAIQ